MVAHCQVSVWDLYRMFRSPSHSNSHTPTHVWHRQRVMVGVGTWCGVCLLMLQSPFLTTECMGLSDASTMSVCVFAYVLCACVRAYV